jgi:DNA primase
LKPSFEIKEKIRDAIDIVDLVSKYVPTLQRKGRIYVGRCPWHDDNRPSLQVNPERQTYRCWVCNLGGDIFSFIEQIERVDFKEALEILADLAGISIPKSRSRFKKSGSFVDPDFTHSVGPEKLLNIEEDRTVAAEPVSKPVLYKSLEWLTEKYHRHYLASPEAAEARKYIQERGISDGIARRFKIGYAPLNSSVLLDWIGYSRARTRTLIEAGVLVPRPNFRLTSIQGRLSEEECSSLYDRFHGRVLFPIRDTNNRTVAFGGRILPSSSLNSPAKYINSPETPIFTKSKMFYGLELAHNAIRAKRRVIITEGYTDAIMAHQFGLEETVAVLGTALGAEHVKILNRFADKIYLVLDGDAAGRKRAEEVLGFFVAQGADMSILTLPDNNDPCDFILSHGKDAFEEQIDKYAITALEYAFAQAVDGVDLSNVIESSKALDSLLSVIALVPYDDNLLRGPSQIRISKILQRLSDKFLVEQEEINARIEVHRKAQNRVHWQGTRAQAPTPLPERAVIPIPQFDDETPEILASRFGLLPPDIWKNHSFLPKALEIEFFNLWWTCPEIFPEMASEVSADDFISPVSRQIFLLGTDLLSRGVHPVTFSMILRRYDSQAMISCLDDIAEKSTDKDLRGRLAKEENRQLLLRQILDAFLSQRIRRVKPAQFSDLRDSGLDEKKKDQKLLELQRLLKEKQQRHSEQEKSGLMDEDAHDNTNL